MCGCAGLAQTPAAGLIPVGTWAELTRSFDLEQVRRYAQLAGDDNPVHTDAAFAATTRFGRPIVHGMLYGSLFGTIFGATIPGSIYVSQTLTFRAPVFVDELITARMEVVEVREKPHCSFATCATRILRAGDAAPLCEGQAVVMLPAPPSAQQLR